MCSYSQLLQHVKKRKIDRRKKCVLNVLILYLLLPLFQNLQTDHTKMYIQTNNKSSHGINNKINRINKINIHTTYISKTRTF